VRGAITFAEVAAACKARPRMDRLTEFFAGMDMPCFEVKKRFEVKNPFGRKTNAWLDDRIRFHIDFECRPNAGRSSRGCFGENGELNIRRAFCGRLGDAGGTRAGVVTGRSAK
jgi:hypothetical protein